MMTASGSIVKEKEIIQIQISRDEMQAFVIINAPSPSNTEKDDEEKPFEVTREEIIIAIQQSGIVFGMVEAGIEEALRSDRYGMSCLIAQGKPPINGNNGYIEYKFSRTRETHHDYSEEKGKVDYRQLSQIKNVRRGELLANRVPAGEGQEGMTVTGKPVAAKPGKPAILMPGKNVVVDDNGDMAYADVDGHVTIIENKINVLPIYEIAGDVDYSTGNVDFVGNVLIMGNITTGFTVKAEGDIDVRGVIEGAMVVAGGNVVVSNGITGGDKAVVFAGGDVIARYIANARVEARNNIIVRDSILQSQIRAGVSVRAESGRGTIVGGVIQAEEEIIAKVIGSNLATATSLEVGVNPTLREEYRQISGRLQERKKSLDQLTTNVQAYQKSGMNLDKLPESKKMALLKLLEAFRLVKDEVNELTSRLQDLEEKCNNLQKGRISVAGVVNPGVHMIVGQAIFTVNDQIKYAVFTCEDGEVRYQPLR
ncbi:MAG: DUF342 domain-containing protein [Methylocystaceae bacterium]